MVEWFGAFSVVGMALCYAVEARSVAFVFAFAFFCATASLYAYSIGSWPFFGVEGFWALVALRRGVRRYQLDRGDYDGRRECA